MSTTWSLVCDETKQEIWIGQGWENEMRTFYSGEPACMEALKKFLNATAGKPIRLTNEHAEDTEDYEDVDWRWRNT